MGAIRRTPSTTPRRYKRGPSVTPLSPGQRPVPATGEERPERLDPLDRRIVAALQVDGRASWRDIARLAGSSESTVARRARILIDSGAVRSTAIIDPIKCGLGYPVLLQLRCEPSRGYEVAQCLATRSDIRFVTVVTGPYDVVAEFVVRSKRELTRFLFEELSTIEGITETSTETVLRNFKTAYDWSSSLLDVPLGDGCPPPHEPVGSSHVELDPVDWQLIARLAEHGRTGFPELAAAVDITESMARRRVEALLNSGAVRAITLVDPGLLGYDVELMLWLQVDLSRLDEVATALAALPAVRYLSATSGYSDLVGEVILRSYEELYQFRTQTLGSLPGIRRADMALELLTVKRAFLRLDDDSRATVDP